MAIRCPPRFKLNCLKKETQKVVDGISLKPLQGNYYLGYNLKINKDKYNLQYQKNSHDVVCNIDSSRTCAAADVSLDTGKTHHVQM